MLSFILIHPPFDHNTPTSQIGQAGPIFGLCPLWPNGWMD